MNVNKKPSDLVLTVSFKEIWGGLFCLFVLQRFYEKHR